MKSAIAAALVGFGAFASLPVQAGVEVTALGEKTAAVVNGVNVAADEFDKVLAVAARQKYYHRQPPEEQLAAFSREVIDGVINRMLILADAERRGMQADTVKVDAALAAYEERYKDSAQWQRTRSEMLPALRARMEEQSRLERLEASVRDAGEPSEAELRGYYESQSALFTEPDKLRLALILLKVDPSSPAVTWATAREEAAAIRARLEKGADFASLANLHSSDPSAAKGGDMGYLHRGTIPAAVHEELDKLPVGAVSEPLTLLEGIALMKVVERAPAKLVPFESARPRAADLWRRQRSERLWGEYVARLRADATISINGNRFPDYLNAASASKAK